MQNITERPADSLGAFSPGLAVQERDRQTALQNLRKLRREARDQIDRLIRFLDESDLDPDLEDGGDDEPWLGFLDGFPGKGAGTMSCDDLERDDSDDEDGADDDTNGHHTYNRDHAIKLRDNAGYYARRFHFPL